MANKVTQLEQQMTQQQIAPNAAPLPTSVRGMPSAETSYDIGGADSDALQTNPLKPGATRGLWQTPLNAIRSAVVSQKSSASPTNSSANGAYQAGLLNNPTTTLATMSVIPDMAVQLNCNSQVLVDFTGQFEGATSATLSFALFRDNVQIGRVFSQVPAANGAPFIVTLNAMDNPSPGVHSYSAQWSTSAGTATAAGYARSIDALNHKPA